MMQQDVAVRLLQAMLQFARNCDFQYHEGSATPVWAG